MELPLNVNKKLEKFVVLLPGKGELKGRLSSQGYPG